MITAPPPFYSSDKHTSFQSLSQLPRPELSRIHALANQIPCLERMDSICRINDRRAPAMNLYLTSHNRSISIIYGAELWKWPVGNILAPDSSSSPIFQFVQMHILLKFESVANAKELANQIPCLEGMDSICGICTPRG